MGTSAIERTSVQYKYVYKGWAKDFSGRISKILPHFNPHGISGARMEAEHSKSTAYPNPAVEDGNLQVTFTLEKASPVKVQILKENGTLVNEIVEKILGAGQHTYSFSLDNLKGGQKMKFLIYKVITSEHSESRKILLVD